MPAKIGLLEHFRKLASFGGREDRASFWPYAALVLGIVLIAGSAMTIPLMMRSMRAMQDFDSQSTDPGPIMDSYGLGEFPASPQADIPAVMPSADFLAAYLAVTLGLAVLLYAAAVARRLHDRGKSGAWGLMPLPFLLYTSVQLVRTFDPLMRGEQPDSGIFISIVIGNLFCWIALGALIVLLAGASDPEPNLYDLGASPRQP